MDEKWVYITEYGDFYQISNTRKVKSMNRIVRTKNGNIRRVREKLLTLKGSLKNPTVRLSIDGTGRDINVNRLIQKYFG